MGLFNNSSLEQRLKILEELTDNICVIFQAQKPINKQTVFLFNDYPNMKIRLEAISRVIDSHSFLINEKNDKILNALPIVQEKMDNYCNIINKDIDNHKKLIEMLAAQIKDLQSSVIELKRSNIELTQSLLNVIDAMADKTNNT